MKTSKKIGLSVGVVGFSALGLNEVSADTTDNNKENLGGGNVNNEQKEKTTQINKEVKKDSKETSELSKERTTGLDELIKQLQDKGFEVKVVEKDIKVYSRDDYNRLVKEEANRRLKETAKLNETKKTYEKQVDEEQQKEILANEKVLERQKEIEKIKSENEEAIKKWMADNKAIEESNKQKLQKWIDDNKKIEESNKQKEAKWNEDNKKIDDSNKEILTKWEADNRAINESNKQKEVKWTEDNKAIADANKKAIEKWEADNRAIDEANRQKEAKWAEDNKVIAESNKQKLAKWEADNRTIDERNAEKRVEYERTKQQIDAEYARKLAEYNAKRTENEKVKQASSEIEKQNERIKQENKQLEDAYNADVERINNENAEIKSRNDAKVAEYERKKLEKETGIKQYEARNKYDATGVTATGNVTLGDITYYETKTNTHLELTLPDGKISPNDYIDIKYERIRAESLKDYDVKLGDTVVGTMRLVKIDNTRNSDYDKNDSSTWDGYTDMPNYHYRLIFNNNINKFKNRRITIDTKNDLNWNGIYVRDKQGVNHNIYVNGKLAVSSPSHSIPAQRPANALDYERVWVDEPHLGVNITDDGKIKADRFYARVVNSHPDARHRENKFEDGDVFTFKIDPRSPVKFDTSKPLDMNKIMRSNPINFGNEYNKYGTFTGRALLPEFELISFTETEVKFRLRNVTNYNFGAISDSVDRIPLKVTSYNKDDYKAIYRWSVTVTDKYNRFKAENVVNSLIKVSGAGLDSVGKLQPKIDAPEVPLEEPELEKLKDLPNRPNLKPLLDKPAVPEFNEVEPKKGDYPAEPNYDNHLDKPVEDKPLDKPKLDEHLPRPKDVEALPKPTLDNSLPKPKEEDLLPKPKLDEPLPKPEEEKLLERPKEKEVPRELEGYKVREIEKGKVEVEKYNYKFYNSAFGNSFVVRFLGIKK